MSTRERSLHHGRPPALDSNRPEPDLLAQLRAAHDALVAYGWHLDSAVDRERLHPAAAQIRRHAARHAVLTLAIACIRCGHDARSALPPDWTPQIDAALRGASTRTDRAA